MVEVSVGFGTVALALLSLSITSFGIKKVFKLGNGMNLPIFILGFGASVTGVICFYEWDVAQFRERLAVKYPGEWLQLYDFIDDSESSVDERVALKNFKEKFGCPSPLPQESYSGLYWKIDSQRSQKAYKELFWECVSGINPNDLPWNE